MPTTRDALVILILFLIPGFISDRALSRQFPRAKREATEIVLGVVVLSLINYALWSPLLLWMVPRATPVGYTHYLQDHLAWAAVAGIAALLIAPVIEGILIGRLVTSERVERFLTGPLGFPVHTIPKSWDWVFSREQTYLVLVTLTDGTKFGAGWGRDSFASSFPNEEDVYFEVVYSLKEDGSFGLPQPLSAGLLLKRSDIRSLEFYHVEGAKHDEQE